MMGSSHKMMGFAAGLSAATVLGGSVAEIIACSFVGLVGSLAPDIDHKKSIAGRFAFPISWVIATLFTHRGITHSALVIGGIVALFYYGSIVSLYGQNIPLVATIYGYAFAAGMLSHVMGDMLTKKGVMFFWPIPVYIGIPLITTGSKAEKPLAISLSIGLLAAPYYMSIATFSEPYFNRVSGYINGLT